MISTITTTTISMVTQGALSMPLGLMVVALLLGLLTQRELLTAAYGQKAQFASKALLVGITPLLLVFLTIVIVRVADGLH